MKVVGDTAQLLSTVIVKVISMSSYLSTLS